jgi:hypothetical protein
MIKPKCPSPGCDSVDFVVHSIGYPPMQTADGKERRFMPKNFICCEKCGTIVSEYHETEEILKRLEAINDNIQKVERNTDPYRNS